MKNFTNNFKQFTSRLSARWLIMALMMLVGTSSAWAATVYYVNKSGCSTIKIYFWGGSPTTDWNGSPSMEPTDECVKDGDNKYQVYKYDVGTNTSCIFRCDNGQTSDLTVQDGKYYYDGWKSKSELTIVKIEPTTIYFDNSNTGWTSVYLWIGKSTENGGDKNYSKGSYQMTRIDNCGEIYKYELYNEWSDATEISFTNTNWGEEGNSICHRYGYLSGKATHIYKTSIADANNIVFKASSTTSKAEKNGTYCNCTIGNNQQNNKNFHEFESTETFSQSMCCTTPQDSDFKITGVPTVGYYTYNSGLEQKPTAEWNNSSNNGGEVTTHISSSSSSYSAATPINAGIYYVFVTSVAGGNFCDLTTKTYIGSYEIKQADQTTPTITANSTNICGKEATFGVSGGESTGDYSYTLDKNDATATLEGTTLKATQSGSVTLKVKKLGDTNYKDSEEAVKVFNFTMPIENVTLSKVEDDKTTYCVGDKVEFKLNYNGPYPTSYEWSGTAMGSLEATEKTANILDNGASWYIDFAEAETYTIALSLTGCNTQSSNELRFTVNALPSAPTFDPAPSYCAGEEITLPIKDNAKNNVTWYDEQGNAAENPATAAGTYTYKAKATNTNGCVSTDFGSYQYTVKPKVGLAWNEISTSMPINNTQNITTTLTGTGDVVYTSNDNTVISVSGSTLKALKEGKATIKATATGTGDYCGTATITKDVTVTCVRVNAPNVTASDICSGSTATLTLNNRQDGVTYKLNSTTGTPIFTSGENDYTTPVLNDNTTYTIYASHASACTNNVEGSVTVTVASAPQTPSLSTNINMLNNTNKTATLTIGNYVEGVTYTLYKDNNSTGKTTTSTTFSVTAGGVYKVKGTNSNNPSGCQDTDFSNEITINVCPTPAKPQLISTAVTTCNGNVTTFGSITITNMTAYKDDDTYTFKLGERTANPDADGKIVISSAANTKYTVTVTNSCGNSNSADVDIAINNITPTISGATFTQPGKPIELTVPTGITAEWSVSPSENVILTDNGDGTATFSASVIGEFVVSATNGTCSDTHEVKVADAFYIYFRNAKEGETAYGNFYHPDQNTEEYRGGAMYYAESTVLPTNGTVANFNQGGKEADIITTDCDGYTWYGFKASADVISGSKYFYVHAKNNINKAGWYTHTVPTKVNLTGDVYYTLCETNVNDCNEGSKGWKIVSVSAPYAGPVVHNLGSTTLGTDEFAALYVTDCSGKEITGYQWNKDGQPYSSVCSYVGKKGEENSNAGETNNIRPAVAGYYSCTVTYEGGTTATSAAVKIDGTYNRSFTSTIPVLVVNTGDKDFPGCQASGTNNYPSKYADKLKAKRSVDVKIYDGKGALVYDRKARMAYRGSSSLNFTKKSYAFCPGDANCGDKDKGEDYVKTAKLNMLGVGDACDKDWVLYAAAADPSLMRNRMVFDTYQAMRPNDWGVHSRYVELIINGEYKGVYVFMDKITMNNNRVKVDEDKGFIVKFDKTDCADRVEGYNGIFGDQKTFSTERTGRYGISTYHTTVDQLFEIEYPEKDDYPTGWASKVATIKGMFQAFEDALEAGDYATVQKYIDYDSWADWFIINEFTKNLDAYRASCIFVYTGEAGAKIEARPLWDQELSFNNAAAGLSGKGANSTSGLLIQNDGVYTDCFPAPFWFTGQLATFETCGVNNGSGAKGEKLANCLLNDPCFVQVVKEKWNQHQFDALSEEKLNALVTKYSDELGSDALDRESDTWPDYFRTSADCSAGGTGYNSVSYSASKTAITSWIADGAGGRREGLTTAINGLTGASFSILITSEAKTTPWEPVEIAVSVTPAGYDYKLEYTDNNLGGVANTIIKEEGDKIIYRIPRPSDWGAGNAEEGERTDIEYGIKATLSVQDGTTVCGTQAAPSSTGKIILQDEPNEKCD